jgi:hypothetical protein
MQTFAPASIFVILGILAMLLPTHHSNYPHMVMVRSSMIVSFAFATFVDSTCFIILYNLAAAALHKYSCLPIAASGGVIAAGVRYSLLYPILESRLDFVEEKHIKDGEEGEIIR